VEHRHGHAILLVPRELRLRALARDVHHVLLHVAATADRRFRHFDREVRVQTFDADGVQLDECAKRAHPDVRVRQVLEAERRFDQQADQVASDVLLVVHPLRVVRGEPHLTAILEVQHGVVVTLRERCRVLQNRVCDTTHVSFS
jgi:hypothetical protein